MNAYLLIIISDIFLSAVFVCQKKYQNLVGTSMTAGLVYNALMGIFSAGIMLVINRFQVNFSFFSIVMAGILALFVVSYIFIGFNIMERGNISLYTMFLMSGGMVLPYIWGVLFLNEELTVFRMLGLVTIIFAIVISNSGTKKTGLKQLLMCIAVFLLNGMTSITAKMHQINPVSEFVTSMDFSFLVMIFKSIMCFIMILLCRKKLCFDATTKMSIKASVPIIILAASSDGISYMLQLIGAVKLPASVLYPFITGFSIFLTSIAGVVVFKEKLTARQWLGVAMCFAGTLMFL